MNLHTTRTAKLGLLAFVAISVALGLVLLARFGGPSIHTRAPLHATVLVDDAGGLQSHADVLARGVRVGAVTGVRRVGARTQLTLELDRDDAPLLGLDPSVSVSAKTPLGESFVDLQPGRAAGAPRNGARLAGRPAVEVDEALRALDPSARHALTGVLADTGRSLRSPAAAARVRGTLDGLGDSVDAIDRLGTTLAGQREDIAATVTDARTILDVLAQRRDDVRGTVTAARTTLAATTAQRRALSAALTELPGLTRETDRTLRQARPLIAEATPVVDRLAAASPALTRALQALPATARDADAVLQRAPALRRAATPALSALRALAPEAGPALQRLAPDLADLVPMLDYLAPRNRTISAWFANTADLGSNGDAKGRWARFFVLFDPASALGQKAPLQENAYTRAGDATANAPFAPGDFPHLQPYAPALR